MGDIRFNNSMSNRSAFESLAHRHQPLFHNLFAVSIYILFIFQHKKDKHFHHSPVVRVIACWMVLGKSGLFSVDMCHSTKLLTPQASFKSQLSIFISKFRHS